MTATVSSWLEEELALAASSVVAAREYHCYKDIEYPGPWTDIEWILRLHNLPNLSWLRSETDYGHEKSIPNSFERYLKDGPWAFWVFAATSYYLKVVDNAVRPEWVEYATGSNVIEYINANGAPNRERGASNLRMPAFGMKNVLPPKYSALFARMWNTLMDDDPNYTLRIGERGARRSKCPDCGTIFSGTNFVEARVGDPHYEQVMDKYFKQKELKEKKLSE